MLQAPRVARRCCASLGSESHWADDTAVLNEGYLMVVLIQGNELAVLFRKSSKSPVTRMFPAEYFDFPAIFYEPLDVHVDAFAVESGDRRSPARLRWLVQAAPVRLRAHRARRSKRNHRAAECFQPKRPHAVCGRASTISQSWENTNGICCDSH